jgi:Flp pilus assembly pilin Flp
MIRLIARMYARLLAGDDRGQATTEYALVMLGAAVIALLVVGWATSGGGAGKIGHLFDRVIDAISGKL